MKRCAIVGLFLFTLAGCAMPAEEAADSPSTHTMLQGVWQLMTIENLETGEVDRIGDRRTIWTQYTDSFWTYVWMDPGREGSTPADFAQLTADEQYRENRAKQWDESEQWRFWGSGGTYELDGNRMDYTNVVSIEPYQVQMGGVEEILYVNDTAYAYHSVPRDGQPVRKFTHRRLDTMGVLPTTRQGEMDPADLRGNWQVMSTRHTGTGEVQQVAPTRTNWFHVTDTHWTYIWMDKGRDVVTPEQLDQMAPEERIAVQYAKIWNERHRPVFWASGGTYRIENQVFVVGPRDMSIEPWMIGVEGEEPISRLDRTAYVYLSPPRADGSVTETTHRRLD